MVDGSKASTFNHSGWSRGNLLTYSVTITVRQLFPIINEDFQLSRDTQITGTSVTMIERGS